MVNCSIFCTLIAKKTLFKNNGQPKGNHQYLARISLLLYLYLITIAKVYLLLASAQLFMFYWVSEGRQLYWIHHMYDRVHIDRYRATDTFLTMCRLIGDT